MEVLLLLPVLFILIAIPIGLIFAVIKLMNVSQRLEKLESRLTELERKT